MGEQKGTSTKEKQENRPARQIRIAQELIAEYPDWMKKLQYFEGSPGADYVEFTGV